LKIKHLSTQQEIVLSAFACTTRDPNKNCLQLKQTFTDSNEKTFTTANGDTYYKLSEVTSWFVTNENRYGYFINDVPESEVTALANEIILPNA
jgi:hypothetical protein